ncbi:MAG: hypothetical protein LBI54_04275, partial [Lachnospiraceae bacterium]|nr:hypothetical protein [Lachnospiraceae bacterium]
MKFAEKLKLRRNLMIMFILLGLCAIVLGIVKICLADNVGFINYYFATGLALLVVSGRKLRQTLRALSDKEKYESLYIKEHDEWNTMTLLKATYYAFATAALLSYV